MDITTERLKKLNLFTYIEEIIGDHSGSVNKSLEIEHTLDAMHTKTPDIFIMYRVKQHGKFIMKTNVLQKAIDLYNTI